MKQLLFNNAARVSLLTFIVCSACLMARGQDPKKEDPKKEEAKTEPKKADAKQEQSTKLRIEVTGGDEQKPVEGAELTVSLAANEKRFSRVVYTKENGIVVIPDAPRGKVSIQVLSSAWKTDGRFVDLNQAEQNVTIRLKKP